MEDDDEERGGNRKRGSAVVEEGYDADQEGDSDRSDEAEQKPVKNKKQPKQKKRNHLSKQQQQISKGLVIYPQICNILFQLLKVCYGSQMHVGESDWYALSVI